MGLDMYAYRAHTENAKDRWYKGSHWDTDLQDFVNPDTTLEKPVEIAYWRKHPHLHGWMFNLWQSKGNQCNFNGDEIELTAEDLDELKLAVIHGQLPTTRGFFFGNQADDHYRYTDLKFIADARQAIADGYRVFYNSSW